MKHRKLRIAWSVTWGIAAVLLIALWVRSYWQWDQLNIPKHFQGFFAVREWLAIDSARGQMSYSEFGSPVTAWNVDTRSQAEELARERRRNPSYDFAPNRGFELDRERGYIWFPHWFPALIFTTLAAVPWLGWSNRFSLRTVLIALTLVGLGLGIVVWLSR